MEKTVVITGGKKLCCAEETNMVMLPSGRPNLSIKRCLVCGCRHFEASVDPGVIFAKLTPLS